MARTLIPGTQQIRSLRRTVSKTLNRHYLLYLPEEYNSQPEKHWPCILFLHGAGERGMDLSLVTHQGIPKELQKPQDFPFIVVSPQSTNSRWQDRALNAFLNKIVSRYRVDVDRLYLTGLSMGGVGTWSLAIAYPHRFAAIAPICGGGNPHAVCAIKHVPVWAFHGAKDIDVPIEDTEVMVQALKACGSNVRFTVYPDADHDSWTRTYANPELYEWFLEHKRTAAAESHDGPVGS